MGDKASLDGEQHILALLAELAYLRAGTALVPRNDTQPFPARRLYGVAQGRELTSVREHHERCSVAGNTPAFTKPQRAPHGPASLILGIAQHGRIAAFCPALLVFLCRVGLSCPQSDSAAGIRRIGQYGIHDGVRQGYQDTQGIPLIQGNVITQTIFYHGSLRSGRLATRSRGARPAGW